MSSRATCVVAAAVAALCAPSLAAAASAVVVPQKDFSLPEAAITHVAAALAANDPRAAFEAFAIDDAANGFDFDRYTGRLLAIDPFTPAPADSALYRELDRAMLASQAAQQLRTVSYSLLTRRPVDQLPIVIRKKAEIAAFRASVDPKKLAGLRVAQIAPVPAPIGKSPRYLKTLHDDAAGWGATDETERAVLYQLGTKTYMGGATLLRYGKAWRIKTLSSALFGTPGTGRVQPISVAAFRAKVQSTGGG